MTISQQTSEQGKASHQAAKAESHSAYETSQDKDHRALSGNASSQAKGPSFGAKIPDASASYENHSASDEEAESRSAHGSHKAHKAGSGDCSETEPGSEIGAKAGTGGRAKAETDSSLDGWDISAFDTSKTAHAEERKSRKHISIIWVIPLLALLLTATLIWKNNFDHGPVITLNIVAADGIEAGKTLVKFRSVKVGMVKKVELSPDYSSSILTIQMEKNTEKMLHKDSKFWIVKPRIEHTGISGLDTLLSGSYIQMSLGESNVYTDSFTALDKPPVHLSQEKGITFQLLSSSTKRLSVGEAVTFRGFDVGAITDAYFDMDQKKIRYKVFVREPYCELVNNNTKFWVSSGVDVSISTSGLNLNTDSLDSIVSGGVSFEQFMPNEKEIQPAQEGDEFELYTKRDEARIAALSEGLLYVIMLDQSLGQLSPGSMVSFNGVKVGEVIKAPWFDDFTAVFESRTLPVLFAINTYDFDRHEAQRLIDSYLESNRLCGQIESSNLLLGQNKLDLRIDLEAKCKIKPEFAKLTSAKQEGNVLTYRGKKVVPLIKGSSLNEQIDAFMQQLNSLDVAGLSAELQNSLKAFQNAMNAFTSSNAALEQTQALKKMADAFENFNRVVKSYGNDTELYKSLNQSMQTIERLLKDISPAIKELGQNPSAILFGGADDPLPRSQNPNKKSSK